MLGHPTKKELAVSIVSRLQAYLRHNAQQLSETILLPPFTLYLRPGAEATTDDYAIPNEPLHSPIQAHLEHLRAECAARGRVARIRFLAEYAPELAGELRSAGMVEESETELLACTVESLARPAPVEGLTLQTLAVDSPLQDVRDSLDVNERGFDPAAAPVTEVQAVEYRGGLVACRAFLARLDGHAAGAGMYNPPLDSVTELVGIATLDAFRGRGVAAQLTAYGARTAFAHGIEVVFLSTGNPVARRIYERLGFRACARLLSYTDTSADGAGL